MIGVAVIRCGKTPAAAGTFLDGSRHSFEGVGPNGIGSEEPDLRLGIVATLGFDHRTNVEDAQPAGFITEAGIANDVVIALVLSAELTLQCDIIHYPKRRTNTELEVVDVTGDNFAHDRRICIDGGSALTEARAGSTSERITVIAFFPVTEQGDREPGKRGSGRWARAATALPSLEFPATTGAGSAWVHGRAKYNWKPAR
jgi:hypothetical protein